VAQAALGELPGAGLGRGPSDIRAVSVDLEPEETTQMKAQGAPRSEWGPRLDPLRHAR